MLYLLQQFFKKELEEEKEPNADMINSFEHLYNMSKPFYQNNHFEMEKQSTESASPESGDKPDESSAKQKQKKEQEDKLKEDPYESSKEESKGNNDDIEPWTAPPDEGANPVDPELISSVQYFDNNNYVDSGMFKPGMEVDCMKYEPDCDEIEGIWAQGTLREALEGAAFRVCFERDDDKYDRIVYLDDVQSEIYPLNSMAVDEMEWRYKLVNNSGSGYVDVYIKNFGWCEARVMASMTNLEETVDQVLLQVTKVPLGKSKNYGVFKDNEFPQLSIRSPLIRKKGTKFDSRTNEEIELHELNNTGGQGNKPGPVGPHSVRKGAGKHTVLKLVINEYFNIGLDQTMIKIMRDTENPISLKYFMKLLEYYARIKRLCPEEHKGKYENEFEVAIEEYVKSQNLSKSIKEFKYEYFGTIFTANKTVVLDVAQKCLQ